MATRSNTLPVYLEWRGKEDWVELGRPEDKEQSGKFPRSINVCTGVSVKFLFCFGIFSGNCDDRCGLLFGYWELNSGPEEGQPIL